MNYILLSSFDGGCTDAQYVDVVLHYWGASRYCYLFDASQIYKNTRNCVPQLMYSLSLSLSLSLTHTHTGAILLQKTKNYFV